MKNKIKKLTLNQFITDIWYPFEIDNGERKPTTLSFYHSMSKYIKNYLGDKKLDNISAIDIECLLKYYRCEFKQKNKDSSLSEKTSKHIYSTLKIIFKSAQKRKYILENPMETISPPRLHKKDVKTLSEDELKKCLNGLSNTTEENNCMIRLFLVTGIRRGECAGLKWDDIDVINQQLHIHRNVTRSTGNGIIIGTPKTFGSNRIIPIPENMAKILKVYKEHQQLKFPGADIDSAFVFPDKTNLYAPSEPTSITRKVKKIMVDCGLPAYSPHILRHTTATYILAKGGDIKSVQNLLGHADASTTLNFYTRANIDQMRAAANKFTSAFNL